MQQGWNVLFRSGFVEHRTDGSHARNCCRNMSLYIIQGGVLQVFFPCRTLHGLERSMPKSLGDIGPGIIPLKVFVNMIVLIDEIDTGGRNCILRPVGITKNRWRPSTVVKKQNHSRFVGEWREKSKEW